MSDNIVLYFNLKFQSQKKIPIQCSPDTKFSEVLIKVFSKFGYNPKKDQFFLENISGDIIDTSLYRKKVSEILKKFEVNFFNIALTGKTYLDKEINPLYDKEEGITINFINKFGAEEKNYELNFHKTLTFKEIIPEISQLFGITTESLAINKEGQVLTISDFMKKLEDLIDEYGNMFEVISRGVVG